MNMRSRDCREHSDRCAEWGLRHRRAQVDLRAFERHACSFIKDLLNPLHKSRLITHENYSTIVKVSAIRCASLGATTAAL
jgi:hypothetical protein